MIEDTVTDKHCDCLNEALRLIGETQQIQEVLQAAGLDVSDIRAECDRQHKVASTLKARLFPNRQ